MAQRTVASRFVAPASESHVPAAPAPAGLASRAVAYLLDSLVLFGFTMLFVTTSFLNIFLRSDSGQENPSDAAIWHSVAILMATVPAWLLFNLALGLRRGQSIGQYVIGLRLAAEDGERPGPLRLLVYWLALHPLLFHPLFAGFWVLLAYVSIGLSGSFAAVIASGAAALLCLAAPLVGLLFALGDPQRRGIHDWIAGTKVVRVE